MNNLQKCGSVAAAMLLFTFAGAQAAAAQSAGEPKSAYGCRNIEEISELQMIEGKDGMFFRILADLRLQHAFTDQTVDNIAAMAKALKKKGTTLIFMPVPTKSQVMPELVPTQAQLYGFDANIAAQIYGDVVRRLNDKGVVAVDIATPMRQNDINEFGEYSFFKSDFHWTAHGASAAAKAISERMKQLPAYSDIKPVRFDMQEAAPETEPSTMRELLQKHCAANLPAVTAHSYRVVRAEEDAGDRGNSLDIFGDGEAASIALVGTSFSDKAISNFAGFLEHWSGVPVDNYSISGGNQFGAILSYMTSREFQEKRPRFLLWENPIYNNLGQYGDAPWKEVIAAAIDSCSEPLTTTTFDKTTIEAALADVKLTTDDVLLADAGADQGRNVTVQFTDKDGQMSTRSVDRGDRLRATGRFYLSLGSLPTTSFSKVSVKFDTALGESTSLSVCKSKPGEDT